MLRLALLALACVGIGGGAADAGEKGPSRADLIRALERGPGPGKGPENAPVVLVEFSDFQCVYCGKFAKETLPKIEAAFIRPGKARFVYRHAAIFGEPSALAAEASACAFDQGKFWPYHDLLFEKRSPLAFTRAKLVQYAEFLGLNGKGFAACLDSKKFAEVVEAETALAQALGVTGTPAFLLNGELVIGAHPFESFRAGIEALLKTPRAPQTPTPRR
jgi:protein-disulfide isomerase